MIEVWKTINEYPDYEISNKGTVRNKYNNSTLKGKINHKGYRVVSLYKEGKTKDFKIHRLVAQAFIPNPENKPIVDHINSIRTDNRVENLRWATYKENMNNPITKEKYYIPIIQFTKEQDFVKLWPSIRDIEKELGADHSHITKCCKGKYKTSIGYKWGYQKDYEQIPFKVFDLTIYKKKVA